MKKRCFFRKNHFEIPDNNAPITVNPKPIKRIIKFREPLTSLYRNIPQRAEIADGTLDTIGNMTACVSELLAKKKREFAQPHIQP
jgi:hypothetical protein